MSQEEVTNLSDNHAPAVASASAVPQPMVKYRIGGGEYPMYSTPRCYVCNCDERTEIERAILAGYSYKDIADKLDPQRILGKDITLSARNLYEHVHNEHLPLEQYARRAVVDARLDELQEDIESYKGQIVDHVIVANTVMNRGFERMASGLIQPDVPDMLNAAKFVASLQKGQDLSVAFDDVTTAFGTFFSIVYGVFRSAEEGTVEVVESEMKKLLARNIDMDPILKELTSRWEKRVQEQG